MGCSKHTARRTMKNVEGAQLVQFMHPIHLQAHTPSAQA